MASPWEECQPRASPRSWEWLVAQTRISRLLRRLPDDPIESPRVVSLDDWAWRRGSRYGTITCDLERHCRLDLLPDQDSKSAAAWLARYPSIEIISRDRGGEYAEAARVGVPQAVQVADRFHLSQNLHEVVDQAIRRRFSQIHQLLAPIPSERQPRSL